MLFTDGMPNQGVGNLSGSDLTQYMQDLQGDIEKAFTRPNDGLFVTAFEAGAGTNFWNGTYKEKWIEITKDSIVRDPRRAIYVSTPEVGPRMEKIVATTIGAHSFILSLDEKAPNHYIIEVPASLKSLRFTYYKLTPATSFTVTNPGGKTIAADGKTVILTGENKPIQVLELINPFPGTYQIQTTAAGGQLTSLIRFRPIIPKLTSPTGSLLQFTTGQIAFLLLDDRYTPVEQSLNLSVFASLTQAGQTIDMKLSRLENMFSSSWSPMTTEEAQIDACVTMTDASGATTVLYNGPVGEIAVDPVTVQAGVGKGVCVSSDSVVTIPLQLIDGTTSQKTMIDFPIQWEAASVTSGGSQVSSAISEVDAKGGSYDLTFKPSTAEDVQSSINASVLVDGKNYKFYEGKISTTGFTAHHNLALTLNTQTLADRLSIQLYRWFHPRVSIDGVNIQIGRRLFDWLGPSSVLVSGTLMNTDRNEAITGIERFSAALVSQSSGKSSRNSNFWQMSGNGTYTLRFLSPGLGLYQVGITDQWKTDECTTLTRLPGQNLLLINDFSEYLFWLLLVPLFIMVIWLILWLLRWRNSQ